jgi:hypothetical protein
MEEDKISEDEISVFSDFTDHYDKNLMFPVELDNCVKILPPTKRIEIRDKLVFLWNMFLSKSMNISIKYEYEYSFTCSLTNGFQTLDIIVVEDPEISFYDSGDENLFPYDILYRFNDGDMDTNLSFGYNTYQNNTKQKIFIHDQDMCWLSKSYQKDFIGFKMKYNNLTVENISKNLKMLIDKIIKLI